MCKTICIHKSIFNHKLNDRKKINNYLNFLNKKNGQTFFKKSMVSNILGWREYIAWSGRALLVSVDVIYLDVSHTHTCMNGSGRIDLRVQDKKIKWGHCISHYGDILYSLLVCPYRFR